MPRLTILLHWGQTTSKSEQEIGAEGDVEGTELSPEEGAVYKWEERGDEAGTQGPSGKCLEL